MYLHRANWHSSATLTEVFPCFFLSCKANARVKPAKMGHGPHCSKVFVLFYEYVLFVLCCSVYCLCVYVYCTVLCCTVLYCTVLYCTVLYCTVLYCTVLLPPGGYPIAVNKYIISYIMSYYISHISYCIISFQISYHITS
jgi:hypothetical protein